MSVETTRGSGGETNRNPPRVPSPPPPPASSSDGSKANGRSSTLNRRTFTRSRSPAPQSLSLNGIRPRPQPPLPSPTAFLRPRATGPATFVLPGTLSISLSSWLTSWRYSFRIDAKLAAEGAILILALVCASEKVRSSSGTLLPSDDGVPIGTFASLHEMSSHANHVHVRALCRHVCFLHLHGLESLFLHKNPPFVQDG